MEQQHGILVLDKPKGLSSAQAISRIKRLGQKKIGHAGTLDPMATGVLLVLLGNATKLSGYLLEGGVKTYGGTLRLGAYPCIVQEDTTMKRCYGADTISERHRHRYEFNNDYREILQKAGLKISGLSPDDRLVETVELSDRDFYVGVQYHPEFKSRPNKAHPLFKGFIEAALKHAEAEK